MAAGIPSHQRIAIQNSHAGETAGSTGINHYNFRTVSDVYFFAWRNFLRWIPAAWKAAPQLRIHQSMR
jgi:hypothetical protein